GSEQSVSLRPTLTVEANGLTGKLAEEVTLPQAEATDDTDGNITDNIQISVYFARDTLTVYESEDGGAVHKFTPGKVGEYTIIYKITNSRNKSARKEISLTVADGDPGDIAKQLVTDRENWVMTDENGFDEEGNLVVKADFGTSVAYAGKKIKSGDTVSFRFSVDPGKEMFYSVNAHMSTGYDQTAPKEKESNNGFPVRLALRVSTGSIEAYVGSWKNDSMPFQRIEKKVCDGKDHTMSLRSTLINGNTIKFEVWVDKDPAASSTWFALLTADEMRTHYGDDIFEEQFADMFSERNFGGWFNIGSYGGNGTGSMTIKALAINGEQYINAPEIETEGELESPYLVGEEIVFPSASSEDKNTYSDLSSRIRADLVKPSGETVTLEGLSYTPTEAGQYTLIYSVSDYSGNITKKSFSFSVATVLNTVAPVISFADGTSETLQATVGTPLTLPVPESVLDEQGTDLSARLKVELLGCEQSDISDQSTVTIRTPGTYKIRYSVTDDCILTGSKDFEVTVTGIYDKDTNLATEDYYQTQDASVFTESGIAVSHTGKVAVQKVYDEKISVKVKGNLVGSFIYVNIRGGKNLNDPNDLNLDWNTGLIVKLSCALSADGVVDITYGGHDQNGQSYSIPQSLGKNLGALAAEGLTLDIQAIDVCDKNGNVTDVLVNVWINGVSITPDGGRIFDSSFIGKNPGILKAGWLTFSAYPYAPDADLDACFITGICIDDGSADAADDPAQETVQAVSVNIGKGKEEDPE
ncbi:MAG: hypothetical protein ACI4RO_01135, partial [Candidatus Scatosoma sp.]